MSNETLVEIKASITKEEEANQKHWDWGFIITLLSVASVFLGNSLVKLDISFFHLYPLRLFGLIGLFFIFINKGWKDPLLSFNSNFIFFFFIVGIASVYWAPDTILAIKELGILQTGLTFTWLITKYVNTETRLEVVIAIWVIGAIFVNLIGLWEVLNQQFLLVTEVGTKTERSIARMGFLAPRSIFGNQNNYAFFNAITSLILLGKLIKVYRPSKLYIVNLISFSLSLFLLICSYSRAAIGGFVIAVAFFLLFILFSKNNLKSNLLKFVIVSFLGFTALLFINPSIVDSFSDKLYLVIEKNNQRTEEGRSILYKESLGYAYDSLGFGRGPGASIAYLGGLPPHNYFLQILIEYGIIIVLLHLWLFFKVFRRLGTYKHVIRNAMPSMLQGSIIAFPLLSIGPSSIIGEGIFWLWLGISLAYSSISLLKIIDNEV